MSNTRELERAHKKHDLKKYRALSIGIPLFFAAYATVVLAVESKSGREEIFPIASWALFSKVPNITGDFSLRVVAIDGVALERPMFFGDSHTRFRAATNHMAHNVLQRLGKAVESGDPTSDDIRTRFEALYLAPDATQVRYELVARRYDPLVRWRTGEFVAVHVMRTFSMGAK